MNMFANSGKLPVMKIVHLDMCKECIFEKQKNVSSQKSGRLPRANKLVLVHSDVRGPSLVASLEAHTIT